MIIRGSTRHAGAIAEFIDDFLMSSASKTAMKLINIVAFTAVFAHFMSCFFAACGLHAWEAYNPLEGTSLAESEYDLELDQAGEENRHRARGPAGDWTRLRQDLVGLYWAITTISTVGYGDFVPVTDKERAYAILAMFIGSGFYGYVVAQAANIISNSDADRAKYYEKMDSVQVRLGVSYLEFGGLWRLHATEVTRIMLWVVSVPSLGPFGPRRDRFQ